MKDKPYLCVCVRGDAETVVSGEEAVGAGDHLPAHSLNDLQHVWTNHSHWFGPITPLPPSTNYHFSRLVLLTNCSHN